jgi:hypothetical protein
VPPPGAPEGVPDPATGREQGHRGRAQDQAARRGRCRSSCPSDLFCLAEAQPGVERSPGVDRGDTVPTCGVTGGEAGRRRRRIFDGRSARRRGTRGRGLRGRDCGTRGRQLRSVDVVGVRILGRVSIRTHGPVILAPSAPVSVAPRAGGMP